MDEKRLNEIRQRVETLNDDPPPWDAPLADQHHWLDVFDEDYLIYPKLGGGAGGPVADASSKERAIFIAHARQDIPDLLDALTAEREKVARLENAWAVDETVQPDGTLRPSLADTVARAERAEDDLLQANEYLWQLSDMARAWMSENSETVGDFEVTDFYKARLHQLDITCRKMLEAEEKVARLEAALRELRLQVGNWMHTVSDMQALEAAYNKSGAALEGGE